MVYVPEILHARLADNAIDRTKLMRLIMTLKEDESKEEDEKALEGIRVALKEAFYEFQSLGKENSEIKLVLQLLSSLKEDKKKKRAPSLPTRRLNSHIKLKSHASL